MRPCSFHELKGACTFEGPACLVARHSMPADDLQGKFQATACPFLSGSYQFLFHHDLFCCRLVAVPSTLRPCYRVLPSC